MRVGEKLCKITFNAKNKLGVKFRLTKEFMVPVYTFSHYSVTNNLDYEYRYTHDYDIINAISKYCEGEELKWWLDGSDNEIGGPPWKDICNLRVLDSCDY